MIKIKKTIFIILCILFITFLTSCELSNIDSEDKSFILTYESIGNGSIICSFESGTEFKTECYVYVLSSPNDEEELLSWTINGENKGNARSYTFLITEDTKVIATFSSYTEVKEEDEESDNESEEYNTNTIYANLPSNWDSVNAVIETYSSSSGKSYSMKQNSEGIWTLNLENNSISKTQISSIYFISDQNKTEKYNFDSDYNFFNYTGYNRNGELSGGFDIKKKDNVMKLSVLEMNDVHGYITQSSEGMAGISNASYIIEQVRNEDSLDDTVLVANGDMFQGSALSNLSFGQSVLNVMNEMKFDFMGIGNHEFDWGLDKIINYFDGNKENGEANFPLVNSNISAVGTKNLITNENIVSSYLFEKNEIKIGVISLIDDLKSSILYSRTVDYDFLGTSLVESQAIELKNQGADIIIANVHGGNSGDATSFAMNQTLAKLTYNGDWLIDCVINGHTHTNQTGTIKRAGQDLKIVQGGSYSYYVGQIDLYIDLDTKELTTSNVFTNSTYAAGKNYTQSVQDIVNQEYEKVKSSIEEVYCTASTTVKKKSELYTWSANVMLTAADAICGISNTGGLRSTGNIKQGEDITLDNVYLINPFDNEIMVVEITGKQLSTFLKNRSIYYSFKDGYSLDTLQNNTKYKVAVIDYVYYWDSFPKGNNDINTKLIYRDCMIEDLRLRETFNPSIDTTPMIGSLIK